MKRKERAKVESINDKAVQYHSDIIRYLEGHEIQKLCYTRKSRVKGKDGIIAKFERKRESRKNYKVEDITDIVGLRFIVLFKQDVIPVIQGIVNLICNEESEDNPFFKAKVEELIYYKGNVSVSNISIKIQDCFSDFGVNLKETASKEGYSSIHIVCRLVTDNHDVLPKNYNIPIEIQIRTIFEDAWGEIDHKYGYQARRESSSSHPTLDKHLKTLKHFVDACVDYADLIVEESEIELNPSDFSKVLNIPEKPRDLKKIFKGLDIEPTYLNRYKESVKLKAKAIEDGNSKSLIECADSFIMIKNDYLKSNKSSEEDVFSFYCSLNYSFCYLVTNTERGIKNAIDMYLELLNTDPKNSLVLMRLGQAMGKIKEFEKCISYLKSSYENALLKDFKFKIKETDIRYILLKTPKTVGYYIWQKIYNSKDLGANTIKELYEDAYSFTLKGYKDLTRDVDPEEYVEYQNNLIYYLTEIYKIGKDEGIKKSILKELKEVQGYYTKLSEIDAITLDTLVNAYNILEDKEQFTKYSRALKDKIFKSDYEFDDSEALEMLMLIDKSNHLMT